MRQRILILGAGFAGLWSAAGAIRKLDELGVETDAVEVVVINRTPFHSIRVRNYEAELAGTLVPLRDVLDPIGVRLIEATVTGVDVEQRAVQYAAQGEVQQLQYDRLVFALGSRLIPPPLPGLSDHGFSIDTYEDAARLQAHIAALPARAPSLGRYTVLVVGAGLTGIEAAAEMPARVRAACNDQHAPVRVILADRQSWIGADMGESARSVIAEALDALGVETRPGTALAGVDSEGVSLANGERIPAATVVWCGGMQAHPLTACFPVSRDRFGRLSVDPFLRIEGRTEFAPGDSGVFAIDGMHPCVMSCQHARPMGRFAGNNVVCDLLGLPMLPLRIEWYATVLDLGAWGAVQTDGWDRRVVAAGAAAKRIKAIINRERIYPPRSGLRSEILDLAAPVVQAPPARS